jgi:hypothetical protein
MPQIETPMRWTARTRSEQETESRIALKPLPELPAHEETPSAPWWEYALPPEIPPAFFGADDPPPPPPDDPHWQEWPHDGEHEPVSRFWIIGLPLVVGIVGVLHILMILVVLMYTAGD